MTIKALENALENGYTVDCYSESATDEVVDILYVSTPNGVQEFSESLIVDVAIELFAEGGINIEDKTVLAEMKAHAFRLMKRAQANLLDYMNRELLRKEEWFMAGAVNELTSAAKIYGRLCQILG